MILGKAHLIADYYITIEKKTVRVPFETSDGELRFAKHISLTLLFEYKKGGTIEFRLTSKKKFYSNGEDISESECLSEFQRLLGTQEGTVLFRESSLSVLF